MLVVVCCWLFETTQQFWEMFKKHKQQTTPGSQFPKNSSILFLCLSERDGILHVAPLQTLALLRQPG